MPIEITEATMHQIVKLEQTQGAGSVTVKPRTTALQNDQVLAKLCSDLVTMYGTVANSSGTLGIDPDVHQWPPFLKSYADGDLDLIAFTTASVELIAKRMEDEFLANGGYALFLRYKADGQDFILVAMLKLKAGAGVDAETLDLKSTLNIDLTHLNEAARVNLTRWAAQQQPHLNFIKGRAKSGKVSDYFRDALSCTNFTDSKFHTEQVMKAATDFINAQEWPTPEDKRKAHQDMRARLVACFEQNKMEVPLTTVAAHVHPAEPQDFLTFVQDHVGDQDYHLTERFTPHRKTYIVYKRVTGKMGSVSVAFDVADVLAERVRYDAANDALILANPTLALKLAIQQHVPAPDVPA